MYMYHRVVVNDYIIDKSLSYSFFFVRAVWLPWQHVDGRAGANEVTHQLPHVILWPAHNLIGQTRLKISIQID